MSKLHVGDLVKVIAGSEKGKVGVIRKLLKTLINKAPQVQNAIVEGINLRVKHNKPKSRNEKGSRDTKEFPIHISNLAYYDRELGTQKISYKKDDKDKKVRYSKLSGEILG